MNRNKVLSLGIAGLMIVGAALFALQRVRTESQQQNMPVSRREPMTVQSQQVTVREMQQTLEFTGELEAEQTVDVYPDISGTVERMLVEIGGYVEKNQEIALIDPSRPGVRYEAGPVRSPLRGWVTDLTVNPGDRVDTTTVIATVATLDRLRITVAVPDRYAAEIRPGTEVRFTVPSASWPDSEKVHTGSVTRINPAVDSANRTRMVYIAIPSGIVSADTRLRPGMFVRVVLPVRTVQDAVTVPFSAVLQEGGAEYVFVVGNGVTTDTAVRMDVKTGLMAGNVIQIIEGLEVGQNVITTGAHRIRSGDSVRVVREETSR
jgi:membrane fusion protein, multidrug efflux system